MASVVIVGGGIAGIAAADLLIRSGFHDVKILEATDRTGGRIWSVDVDDNIDGKAELGANYIHGIERNPIYKIADENDLLELRNKEKGLRHRHVYVTDQGDIVSKQIVQEVDWAYGMLMQQCEEFFHLDIATPCKNDSVGAFMEREYDRKVGKYSAEEKHIRQLIFNQRLAYEAVISGSDSMYDVSLGELGSYEELPGIHYTIPPGFEMVLEIIKRNIPPEDIVLNKPVTCICWNQGDKYESHHQVCVECEDGEKFYADHVIVTVSLGCLKYNAKRFFSPPLPKCKLDAIESLDIGTVGKVILEFDEAIFPPDVRRLELLWDKDHYDDCDKEMSKCWFRKIYSFEMIQENVVLGWLSGKNVCIWRQ
ncbi:spermine oxidase [Lingula anatina]|uniref:Spermine oxidase n=1 Tax=Lingula anatina TaxID=7574 RepID=A0A1S3IIN4_LINAN|nr:spermine oxidase [Lingula anatina]|eukprot:XP_013397746.1 spermine oxidase [Lingula anatina]